jgi:ribonuclease HI
MPAPEPHFLLYSDASHSSCGANRWTFVLQSLGGDERLSATDSEPNVSASRLELLAVVRGLEALEGPSRVTLLTRSRYVSRGLRRDLKRWREAGWQWDCFGERVPIRDCDLWQRVDRALDFHQVECWSRNANERNGGATKYGIGPNNAQAWSFAGLLNRLRQGVFAPRRPILRPAFTNAA